MNLFSLMHREYRITKDIKIMMTDFVSPICCGIVGALIGAQYKHSFFVGGVCATLLYAGAKFV